MIANIQTTMLENKHKTLYSNLNEVKVIGIITSNGKETDYKKSYEIKVQSINENTKFKNTKLIIYVDKNINLEFGKRVQFTGEFSMPSHATNYKAFDYGNYLKTKNIYGSVNANKKIDISEETYLNPLFIASNKLKNKIETNLDRLLGENSKIVKRNITSVIQKKLMKK